MARSRSASASRSTSADDHAQPGNPNALVDKYVFSATTGRTMEEIREGKPAKKNFDDQLPLWGEN